MILTYLVYFLLSVTCKFGQVVHGASTSRSQIFNVAVTLHNMLETMAGGAQMLRISDTKDICKLGLPNVGVSYEFIKLLNRGATMKT